MINMIIILVVMIKTMLIIGWQFSNNSRVDCEEKNSTNKLFIVIMVIGKMTS